MQSSVIIWIKIKKSSLPYILLVFKRMQQLQILLMKEGQWVQGFFRSWPIPMLGLASLSHVTQKTPRPGCAAQLSHQRQSTHLSKHLSNAHYV